MNIMSFMKKNYYVGVTSRETNGMVEASVKMGFLFDPFLLSKLDLGFLIF